MSRYGRFALFYVVILFLVLNITLNACASSQVATSSQFPKIQQLRITNNGSYAVDNLVVKFPGVNIAFGDVPAGITTEYKDVQGGVLRYAAYDFEIDGEVATQAVIDWMGENPMDGSSFTYMIDYDPARFATNDSIQLLEVKIDN